jgi:hypothetical protein
VRYSRTFNSFWRGALPGTLIALACPGSAPYAQQVYKSVDAQGHVVYSDRGATKDAAKSSVHVAEPDPAEVARLAKEQELMKADDIERTKQQASEDKTRAAADRKRLAECEKARNNFYRLKDAPRIYQRDADGNRVYYADDEADKLREQARRAMTAACGT